MHFWGDKTVKNVNSRIYILENIFSYKILSILEIEIATQIITFKRS